MPSVADLFGVPSEVSLDGKVYKLRPPTQLEQMEFSRWLERRAREHAARAVELPREQQDNMLRWVGDDSAACLFEWESEACNKALTTPLGMAKILHLILRSTTDPEFTFEQAQELVRAGLANVFAEILAAKLRAEGLDDPKAAAAAVLRTLGLPSGFSSSPSATPPSKSPETNSSDSPTTKSPGSTPGSGGTSTDGPT